MAKALKYFLIVLIVSVGIGFVVFSLMIGNYIKSNIEKTGSDLLGTEVTVDAISVSPFSGRGTVTGFRIANPEGFSRDEALTIDEFTIELDLFTLWSDVIVINEILITSPSIYVEQQIPENNLRTILNHFNDKVSSESGSYGEMVIEHFVLEEGVVELYTEVGGEQSARVEMSRIEIEDLGQGGGEDYTEQVIQEIARRVVEQAMQAAFRSGASQLRDAIEDIFQ